MGSDDAERTLTRQFAIGDVRYDITVNEFSENMHRATWTCSTCKEQGAWAPISANPGQAIESAIMGIEMHHSFAHGIQKTNSPHFTRNPID